MKSKSLLIIGGTGFFGKSILDYFRDNDALKIKKILVYSRNARRIKIDKILKKKIKIVKVSGNIINAKKLPRADYVIYGAILKNYEQDLIAVKNYTKLAIKYHLNSKILYVSSGAIYGIQKKDVKQFKEDYLQKYKKVEFKNGYKKKYSIVKFANENYFKKLGTVGLNVSIVRCFSFVGRNLPQNSHYVIGNIINNILKNRKISIEASYKIVRSYMYSDDLVRWLLKILQISNLHCPIYNVGSDNAVSIHSLATTLSKKYRLQVKFKNKVIYNKVDKYIPSIKKAYKELGLTNNYSSLEAIIKTIDLIKNEKTY